MREDRHQERGEREMERHTMSETDKERYMKIDTKRKRERERWKDTQRER